MELGTRLGKPLMDQPAEILVYSMGDDLPDLEIHFSFDRGGLVALNPATDSVTVNVRRIDNKNAVFTRDAVIDGPVGVAILNWLKVTFSSSAALVGVGGWNATDLTALKVSDASLI